MSGLIAALLLCFVVCLAATVTQQTCMDGIDPDAEPMPGGYFRVQDPNTNKEIMHILKNATAQYRASHQGYKISCGGDTGLIAYEQVVAGYNYCVQFNLITSVCRTDTTGPTCMSELQKPEVREPKKLVNMSGLIAALLLCFLVCLGATVTQQTCVDGIDPGAKPMPGGYFRVQNPRTNKVIIHILRNATRQYRSNHQGYTISRSGQVIAYEQVVAGYNYCVQFHLITSVCRTDTTGPTCMSERELTCVVSAYQPLEGSIIIDKPSCT